MGDPGIPYLIFGVGYTGLLLITLIFAYRFLMAFEQRQDLLQIILNKPNESLDVLDLRGYTKKDMPELPIIRKFSELKYGQAFLIESDHELTCQHHELHKILNTKFAWEVLEMGPKLWKVKIGKLN